MLSRPGLLAVWNDLAAEDEAEFNAWYVEEHVPERLGIPGVHSARRYRDAASPLAYLERLAHPSARTRAIMPRFRNMTRAACEIGADFGALRLPGAVLATIELDGAPEIGRAHV